VFVYLITNEINGKGYVGQHSGTDLQKYWDKHKGRALSSTTDEVRALYFAVRKYGQENFKIEPLLIVKTKEEMDFHEIRLIREMGTKAPNGYNLTDGGEGVLNPSEESRRKMSDSHKGKKQSEETKIKRSEKLRGQKRTEETKKRMSLSQIGNQNFLGHTHSEETRKRLSEVNKGNKNAVGAIRTPEYLKALSDRFKGRVFSTETRRRMSVACHKRHHVARGINNPECKLCQGINNGTDVL
jgi:group I intron endonuclease